MLHLKILVLYYNHVKNNHFYLLHNKLERDGEYEIKIIFKNNITNLNCFFSCTEYLSIDLSNFDTTKVNDMGWMFNECKKLKEIKGINKFNTSNVTIMNAMFQLCNELEYLDLSNFDTSNVTNMEYMFNKCKKLKEIKGINNFITKKVEDMDSMFNSCSELEQLDLSNFNTTNVMDMTRMFHNCNSLKYLNLLNFTINCETEDMLTFQQKNNCNFITNNLNLKNIYNS